MNIRIVDETDMTKALDKAIRDGLCASYPEQYCSVFSQTRQWHGSWPSWTVVVDKQGVVEAHVAVVDRVVTVGNEPVRVAGVQNVFVIPRSRGRGLAKVVMKKAVSEASYRGFECGLLFCQPELRKVYAACQWQLLPRERIVRVDESGQQVELPTGNIAMYFPLTRSCLPSGIIQLQGNDW